jgi:hypothetical protein
MYFDHIETVKEIFPEKPLIDQFLQITVGGGDDAHIGFYRDIGAKGFVNPVLQNPEQFYLQ